MVDRTSLVPSHTGYNILPADPLFIRLISFAYRKPQRIAIRDDVANIERTHIGLLNDVLSLRKTLQAALSPQTIADIENGKDVFIAVLASGGYEFSVAILAVLALGAAVSPLSIVQPVEEASYYIQKSQAPIVLASSAATDLGFNLEKSIKNSSDKNFKCIAIIPSLSASQLLASDIQISSNRYLNDNAAGVLIFTSGTTGPPKGAVLSRAAIRCGASSFADQFRLTEEDSVLHLLPVHHATGIWISFFPFVLSGSCIEFRSGSFDPRRTWDRWRRGGLTFFSGVPTMYMRMMRYRQQHLSKLPASELAAYDAAASQFRGCLCGTSALPKPISKSSSGFCIASLLTRLDDFWTGLMKRRIYQRYGATEIGVVFHMTLDSSDDVPDGSIGEVAAGVDVKLSEGEEGEVLVRSPFMLSRYLYDPEATAKAHDTQGYYHSGDIARREGKYYWIVGRASVDIIKSGGYKISALDIEREILALPYIAEVMVAGVADEEFGERVAAAVSIRDDELAQDYLKANGRSLDAINIDDLRQDLRQRLAGYKLPTLLRVVKGDLPKGASGKVVKKLLGPQFFPQNYESLPEVQIWKPSERIKLASKL